MKSRAAVWLRVGLAAAVVAALTGCGKGEASKQEATSQEKSANPLAINTSPELLKHIRIGEPKVSSVAGSLHVTGRVEADETRMARISAPVTGRIYELDVLEGQHVKRGQVLATLHSTGLADAQFAFVKAYSQQQLADRGASRAKLLLDADVIGSAELQRREAELLQASAELSSARDQLKVLGMPDDAIAKLEKSRTVNSLSQLVASIDGMVLDRKVTIGQVVQPAEIAFVIADLSNVWLVADVPEQNAGNIVVGKEVEAEIPALPDLVLHGKLSFVSSRVNPDTRTVRTRMDVPNPRRKFKPAMLASMVLKDGVERQRVIPATAVVREGNEDHVFIQTDANTFVLREVTLGAEYDNTRVLMTGVEPGERIVLDGAFHLNNERKRLALQGGD